MESLVGEPSVAGAAVQAVVVVNLTQFSDANLLVAALLDNPTGGVNGSFTNVTADFATLGFAPGVWSALPKRDLSVLGLVRCPRQFCFIFVFPPELGCDTMEHCERDCHYHHPRHCHDS